MFKKILDIFRARVTDPIESKHAAIQAHRLANNHYGMILKALRGYGPMGKDAIAYKTGLDSNQISRRMSELHQYGLVALTGEKTTSKSGRTERVWAIVGGD